MQFNVCACIFALCLLFSEHDQWMRMVERGSTWCVHGQAVYSHHFQLIVVNLFCYFQFITYATLCVAMHLLFTGVCVYDKTDKCLLLQGCVQPFVYVKCYTCHTCS